MNEATKNWIKWWFAGGLWDGLERVTLDFHARKQKLLRRISAEEAEEAVLTSGESATAKSKSKGATSHG